LTSTPRKAESRASVAIRDVDGARIALHVDHATVGEPLEQRVDVAEVGRRLLAHHRLPLHIGIQPQEGGEEAALGALGGQQPALHLVARHLAHDPAPERANLAPARVAGILAFVEHLDDAPHGGVVAQVAGTPEVLACTSAAEVVAHVVVLLGHRDALAGIEQAAHHRRPAARDANNEDRLGSLAVSVL
jgi:hypothetical protein